MIEKKRRISFTLLLLVEFIDYLGMGLALPFFAAVLFDVQRGFLATECSAAIRGTVLAMLIAVSPLMQFFSSPFLGTLSDIKGRKRVLIGALSIGILGYICACFGVWKESILFLFLYRFLFGISSGSAAVVQASVSEISAPDEKTKNFGLVNMALGAGFCLGPFVGGVLSDCAFFPNFGQFLPFLFVALLSLVNLLFIRWKFIESWKPQAETKLTFDLGFSRLGRAWQMIELRYLFLAMFLFFFGWNFFVQFVPVVLIDKFGFNLAKTGYYYGFTGIFFALSSGLLIRPIVRRFASFSILWVSLILAGGYLLLFLLLRTEIMLWIYTPIFTYLLALVYPSATASVATAASEESQGEVLGIYSALQALSLVLGPLLTGSFIGIYPQLPILLGALVMITAGLLLVFLHRRRA